MERLWKIGLLGVSLAALTASLGCDRGLKGDSARIVIQAPQSLNKVGAMAALPANRKVCYAVNVTGEKIPITTSTCSPQTGVLVGFVEPGQEIVAKVPKGSARKVELFIFLLPENQNTLCPILGSSFPSSQINDTYLVATANNVNTNTDEVTLQMTLNFPGLTQTIAQDFSLPSTCAATAHQQPIGFGVTTAAGAATGTGMKMYGRVGTAQPSTVLTGSGIKLLVRE